MKTVFHFLNTGNYSGAENVVLNIALLVKDAKHVYVSPDGRINAVLAKYGVEHLTIEDLSVKSLGAVIDRYQPDIVQAHDFTASIAAALNRRRIHAYGGHIISHLHSNDARMTKLSPLSILYRWALPAFDQVLVVSQAVIDEYYFKKALAKKAQVLPNIVNPEILAEKVAAFEADPVDIILVGRLVPQKGYDFFLEMIAPLLHRYSAWTVRIVGDGPLEGDIRQQIQTLGLNQQIELLGYHDNPYPYMKAAKIMVLTSRVEGFGLVALEAELLGDPVVSTAVGGLTDLVNKQVGLASNDVAALRDEIERLLTNEAYRHQKAEAAAKRGQEVNRVSDFVGRLTKLYEED
ncbi:glycosyltransferase [Eupransor demetentiae]|uniref:Glycosyltransferase involved in cell wall bisynthesis (RfaB) n=1 Tax=Eupransor demetentiae TaxID=3109584 RepID=A0ABM9N4K0_9LACO|nr:Glycosyltransferase involved in cell wall bisynthesis (RfaB) [Lactobacillaceae bacterium LMG 33000]